MIRLEPPHPPLSSAEHYAADTILDASRLLRTADGADLDVVRLRFDDRPTPPDVASLRAASWFMTHQTRRSPAALTLSTVAHRLGGAGSDSQHRPVWGAFRPTRIRSFTSASSVSPSSHISPPHFGPRRP
jgi:hypothetical protein